MVTLTEDLLIDAGGWQVLKEARAIHAAGRVAEAKYESPFLLGLVKAGNADYRSGLKISSTSDIENLCTCPDSRRRGVICAHSIAVALEVLKPTLLSPPAPVSTPAVVEQSAFPLSPDSAGEPLELSIILPPKFAESWNKGSISVVVEAQVGSHRKPFANVDLGKTWRCDPEDARFAQALLSLTAGKPVSMIILTREQMSGLLDSLTGHPRVTFGKSASATISEEGIRPALLVDHQSAGALHLASKFSDHPALFAKNAVWLLQDNVFKPVARGLPAAYFPLLASAVPIPADHARAFMEKELPMLAGYFSCDGIELPEIAAPPVPPPQPHLHLQIEGSLNFLSAKFIGPEDAEKLAAHGFAAAKGEYVLRGEQAILAFFSAGLPRLQKMWKVEIGERFQHVTRNIERIEPHMEIRGSGEQWFDLGYDLRTASGDKFSSAEIARLLQSGVSHLKRPSGKVAVFDQELLDDFSELLAESNPQQLTPGVYRLQNRYAGGIHAFAEETGTDILGDPAWKKWAAGSRHLERLTAIPLGTLEATLRPYQKQGVYWLHFLAQNRFGGILADEMGLGKSLQSLAFLRTLRGQGPSLVVCPSSLIFNWKAEAAKWTPELQVLSIEGPGRLEVFPSIPAADLVITSYPLLRIDVEEHRKINYAAVILDEAQQIKNPDSQNAKAAGALRASRRFALTGTPVENSVRDLWSILNFLMPGYLGTRKEFQSCYQNSAPASREQARLRRRISPFLLRRTKAQVASDLPAKMEQIAWCELTPQQSAIYSELAKATRTKLFDLAGAADQRKSRIVMLTALLRLRQAACDVRLLGLENPPPDDAASAKLDLLEDLLEEALDGGHRVLVFSQFVSMLTQIRHRLDLRSLDYCYLDGQSKDRSDQVQKFQVGQTPVFLISLKAGGTGLNLTAADTVIHFDPWWNPAVEAQATDRAHRIGQKKLVTSYKLIARGTVEEKILNLQAKKRSMIAATLESEQPLMEGLSLTEIEELLQ